MDACVRVLGLTLQGPLAVPYSRLMGDWPSEPQRR